MYVCIFGSVWKVVGNLQKIIKNIVISVFIYYKQNITCPLVDMNFIFACSTRYLTCPLRSLVRYWVEHAKIKFISSCRHVIFSMESPWPPSVTTAQSVVHCCSVLNFIQYCFCQPLGIQHNHVSFKFLKVQCMWLYAHVGVGYMIVCHSLVVRILRKILDPPLRRVTENDCTNQMSVVGPAASRLGWFRGTMGMYFSAFCSSTNLDQRVGCYSRECGTWQRKFGAYHRGLV